MNKVILNTVCGLAKFLGLTFTLWALTSPAAFAACSVVAAENVCTSDVGVISLNGTAAFGATSSNPQPASVYPSNNVVSGLAGTITSVRVRLNGLTHDWAYDLNMVLVSPTGQPFIFWSSIGPNNNATQVILSNNTFTISDGAASALPQGTPASGTYRPANYGAFVDTWPAPASVAATVNNSAGPFGVQTFSSRFNGASPNGTWKLYITVTGNPDAGSLQSWDLIFATAVANAPTTTTVTSSANPAQIPLSGNSTATLTATVTSAGNPVTLGTVSFFEGATALATNVPVNASGVATMTFNTTGVTAPVLVEGLHNINVNYSGATGFGASSGSITQTVDRATQVTGNTYCNTGKITVPQAIAAASVYPSRIFVSGLAGTTQSVVMDLKGFTNPATDDVNMLLVSPTGQKFVPFAYISDFASATSGANIKLDDLAGNALPNSGPVASGTYRPSHGLNGASVSPVTFVAPAPAGPYSSAAPGGSSTFTSTFSGASPNGTWTLYAVNWANTATAGTREITNGWCLTLGTSSDPATTTTPSVTPSPSVLNQSATVSALVVNASTSAPVNAQGSVIFKEGNTVLAGPIAVAADGSASFTTSSLTQGAHFIDAFYSGAPGFFGVSNGQVLHYVDAATTNPSTGRFCNATPLAFPNAIASGSPYPTRINASGLAGALSKVTIELNGLTHQTPDDLDLMLSGPNGNSLIVFSDVGGFNAVSGLTIFLDSSAANSLPDSTTLTSGIFRPTDFEVGTDTFAAPAPTANVASASTTTLGTSFNNSNPNGIWTLWTKSDGAGALGGGSLSSGWCVNLTMTPPALTISKTHIGNFTRGQTGATYTVTVGNAGPGPTAGTLAVVDTVPAGLSVTAMAGSGWTCTVGTRTCTTTAVLAASGSLPPITVIVDVASNATSPQANSVTVSGGGASGASATDTTIILAPDLTLTKTAQGVAFQQGGTVTYLLTVNNIGAGPAFGNTTVTDIMPTGLTATSATGTNWTCTLGATVACTNTTPIAAGTNSVITLVANIALNAAASITNTAAVLNAAESNTANNSGSATISVSPGTPDLTLTKSSPSTFVQGSTASYTLTVTNGGNAPTTAAYTIADPMPTGLTAGTPTGGGWNCAASTSTIVSCTSSTVLAPGALSGLTIPVTIAANAPASITNTATVSGGGEINTSNNAASVAVAVAPQPVPVLVSVVSSKVHNGVTYDSIIDHLQLIDGAISIESRIGSSGHTLVFHFDIPVTLVDGLPTVIDANNNPVGNATASVVGGDVVVALTNIPDRQRITVGLSGLNGLPTGTARASLGYMLGDVNGSRAVNSSDISSVKARSGQPTTALNFMFDVNASGAINSSHISAVKARSGTSLP